MLSRPPVILSLAVEMLSFDASQSWCFTRLLSVAVGDLVPIDDSVWQLYLRLRIIMDIVLAPTVSDPDVELLSVTIS